MQRERERDDSFARKVARELLIVNHCNDNLNEGRERNVLLVRVKKTSLREKRVRIKIECRCLPTHYSSACQLRAQRVREDTRNKRRQEDDIRVRLLMLVQIN